MTHIYKYTIIFPCAQLTELAMEFLDGVYPGEILLETEKNRISVDHIEEVVEDLHCMGIYDFQIVVNPLCLHE